jgi:hypothetical protein
MSRLNYDNPALAEQIASLAEADRRAVALIATRSALDATRLSDPRLDVALAALTAGLPNDTTVVSGIEALVAELDEKAWALMDNPDASSQYLATFSQARAAAALGFLFDADATTAACEAIYEASKATDQYPVIDSIA